MHLNSKLLSPATGANLRRRHAFCPACARAGDARHQPPISRVRDAGLWRVTCLRHGVYLDSVREAGDIYSERPPGRHGRLRCTRPLGEPAPAPNFATAFDRAAIRACERRRPGGMWKVRNPANFLRASSLLGSLMLVERRAGAGVETSMAALLGAKPFAMPGMSAAVYEANLIRRAPAFLRARAFAAASLLLLKPRAAIRLGLEDWVRANLPFDRPENFLLDPWRVSEMEPVEVVRPYFADDQLLARLRRSSSIVEGAKVSARSQATTRACRPHSTRHRVLA